MANALFKNPFGEIVSHSIPAHRKPYSYHYSVYLNIAAVNRSVVPATFL